MKIEEIVALIVFAIMGIGVLLGVANNLMYTQQSVVAIPNTTLIFINNTDTKITSYSLVPNSETVYGGDGVASLKKLNKGKNYTIDYNEAEITPINQTLDDWWNTSRYNISYQYYPSSYAQDQTVRTIYSAILPLIAIALLFWVWYFFRGVKE